MNADSMFQLYPFKKTQFRVHLPLWLVAPAPLEGFTVIKQFDEDALFN